MKIKRFRSITSAIGKEAFAVRRKVFIQEQQVDEREEFDVFEKSSTHYVAVVDGKVVGTARWRLTELGIKLERFAVLSEHRNKGVGQSVLQQIIKDVKGLGQLIYLNAQLNALPFYKKNGFNAQGEQFMECNIPHYCMHYAANISSGLSVQEAIGEVRTFHDAFKITNASIPTAQLSEPDYLLRYRLMKEENDEYLEAAKQGDLVEIADALGDMLYILCGTILKHGLQDKFEEVFLEIQRSNMSKLDNEGQPIYREDGKVLKSDLYFKPNIAAILND
jgi:predicted GNAT family N-acyltransferase/predicted HAD superfamily Cof-like phosphohydrolase